VEALEAGFWGFVGGASLLIGAFAGLYAGGAILTMLASTLFPEAYEEGGHLVGIVSTIGFLIAFLLSRME
jgi:ZIP family zinc transporter